MKQKVMGNLSYYFDYAAYCSALFNWNYTMGANGHIFRLIRPSNHSASRAYQKVKALYRVFNVWLTNFCLIWSVEILQIAKLSLTLHFKTRVVSPYRNTSSAKATILGICWRRWERATERLLFFSLMRYYLETKQRSVRRIYIWLYNFISRGWSFRIKHFPRYGICD